MVIRYSIDFIEQLERIVSFIAKDSQTRADEFSSTLRQKVESIPQMPIALDRIKYCKMRIYEI